MAASTSAVSISNLALAHFGTGRHIESFTERSPEAGAAKLHYDQARRETLEAFNWGFARKRLELALHSDPRPHGWLFRYQMPVDCLAVREIHHPAFYSEGFPWSHFEFPAFPIGLHAIPYEILEASDGTLSICTDKPCAELVYTRDVDLPGMFTPLFVQALSLNLASKMAMQLTQKLNLRNQLVQDYQLALSRAAASAANQEREHAPKDADWIAGRL